MNSLALDRLSEFGFVLLPSVFPAQETELLADRISAALDASDDPSVLRSRGKVYGCRNLPHVFPEVFTVVRSTALREIVSAVLGSQAGMVRALYFDKPPQRSWSLPWHQDRMIAVKDNQLSAKAFRNPTFKAGIPHVEAPVALLAGMLTLRMHLDPMTAENGPLSVILESHKRERISTATPIELHAAVGDVLAMRPLLSHSSSISRHATNTHRRVLHLEFAPENELPDHYEWYSFTSIE